MKKQFLAFLLGACLTSTVITGCSSNKATTETTTKTTAETTSKSESKESNTNLTAFDYNPDDYITLGTYTGLTLDSAKTEVTDNDVEAQIQQDLDDNPIVTKITDRKPKDGDYVVIDFTSTVDGKNYESSSDYEDNKGDGCEIIIGDGSNFGDDVNNAIKKASIGDSFTVKTTLPDSYDDDAGKDVTYKITLKEIRDYKDATLTKDFVKENFDCDSIDDYKKSVKERLYDDIESSNNDIVISNALSKILETSKVKEYPTELHDYYDSQYREFYEYFASSFGIEVSDMIADDELDNQIDEATAQSLIINAIAKKENIMVTEDAYQKYLEDNYSSSGYSTASEFEEETGKEALIEELQKNLVGEFLLANNKLNKISQTEFNKLYNTEEEESEATTTEE